MAKNKKTIKMAKWGGGLAAPERASGI